MIFLVINLRTWLGSARFVLEPLPGTVLGASQTPLHLTQLKFLPKWLTSLTFLLWWKYGHPFFWTHLSFHNLHTEFFYFWYDINHCSFAYLFAYLASSFSSTQLQGLLKVLRITFSMLVFLLCPPSRQVHAGMLLTLQWLPNMRNGLDYSTTIAALRK